MASKSKKILVYLVIGLGMVAGYLIYALSNTAPALADTKGWAIVMLVALGIGIGVVIVTEVVWHIVFYVALTTSVAVKEKRKGNSNEEIGKKVEQAVKRVEADKEDEMDKKINLRASQINMSVVGIGLAAALVALACGAVGVVAMHIVLGACALGSITDGASKIIFYEKGIKN